MTQVDKELEVSLDLMRVFQWNESSLQRPSEGFLNVIFYSTEMELKMARKNKIFQRAL